MNNGHTSNLNTIFESRDFLKSTEEVVVAIKDVANSGSNEASIASAFELNVYSLIKDYFKKIIIPEKELSTSGRLLTKGRIDSSFGFLIIEFKQPAKFKTSRQRIKAQNQLISYLMSLYEENNVNIAGLLTDGMRAQVIRIENGFAVCEAIVDFNADILRRIIRLILSLDQVALTSKNLIRDFCFPPSGSLYKKIAKYLYKQLSQMASEKSQMLFGEWKELFRLAHDDQTKQLTIEQRKKALATIFDKKISKNLDEYEMLYALQTTYAIIVKLIGYKVLSDIQFGVNNSFNFKKLANLNNEELRKILGDMEDGAIFRKAGILNLLEGDFFSWYVEANQWTEEFGDLIKQVVIVLSKYEDKLLASSSIKTQDLFHEMYEEIIPFEVRHSLGEFYTPAWLADFVVEKALGEFTNNKKWKALDPCAGSGTFITKLLERVLNETESFPHNERLTEILSRVVAVDLNPLAVLTTRMNYFINISHLVDTSIQIHLPVYLGDSSYVPKLNKIDNVECYEYQIQTLKGPINVSLPTSALNSASKFSNTMTEVESDTKQLQQARILGRLESLCSVEQLTPGVRDNLAYLAKQLVDLEKRGWNGIWARIVTNFLSTASLGKFDLIVGNPPWIDWKNLPAGYRERIKSICIDRHLFSGDRVTGGINLNICALISNVAADNWLAENGTIAFLMPSNMLVQQTYEGFRNFRISGEKERLYLQKIIDFEKSGDPFKPVTYSFSSYFYKHNFIDYSEGIPVDNLIKIKGSPRIEKLNQAEHFSAIENNFQIERTIAGTVDSSTTAFTKTTTVSNLKRFRKIAGTCQYIGREGIEFYPQELFLLIPQFNMKAPSGKIYVKNYQNSRSKYQVSEKLILLETKFLYPLIRGKDIGKNSLDLNSQFLVPFPYIEDDMRLPISLDSLQRESPLLADYLLEHKVLLETQTDYNSRIIGKKSQEFYALARVGEYSFQDIHVAYRDNSKWGSVVTKPMKMKWGEMKKPLFQNHAPTICEREDGKFIDEEEAYYVSGILNLPLVEEYILSSSDSRTFKIRPPVSIPLYDENGSTMKQIAELAQQLVKFRHLPERVRDLEVDLEKLYLSLL